MSSYEERKQKEEKHEFGFWMFIAGLRLLSLFVRDQVIRIKYRKIHKLLNLHRKNTILMNRDFRFLTSMTNEY